MSCGVNTRKIFTFHISKMMDWEFYDRDTNLALYYGPMMGVGTSPDPKREITRKETNNVLTPFWITQRTIPHDEGPGLPAIMNYHPYQLYALRSRVSHKIRSKYPNYHVRYDQVAIDDKMVLELMLRNGTDFVPISPQDKIWMDNIVSDCLKSYPDYMYLISDDEDIKYDGCILESSWLKVMLPRVSLPQQARYSIPGVRDISDGEVESYIDSHNDSYAPYSDGYAAIYDDGSIYVKLDHNKDYREAHQRLQSDLLSSLVDMHRKGALVLDSQMDSNFIESWSLTPMEGQDIVDNSTAIYTAKWSTLWLGDDVTTYLLNKYRGEMDITHISSNNAIRYNLVKSGALGDDATVVNKYGVFNVQSLREALEGMDMINRAIVAPSHAVYTVDNEDEVMAARDLVECREIGVGRLHLDVVDTE